MCSNAKFNGLSKKLVWLGIVICRIQEVALHSFHDLTTWLVSSRRSFSQAPLVGLPLATSFLQTATGGGGDPGKRHPGNPLASEIPSRGSLPWANFPPAPKLALRHMGWVRTPLCHVFLSFLGYFSREQLKYELQDLLTSEVLAQW